MTSTKSKQPAKKDEPVETDVVVDEVEDQSDPEVTGVPLKTEVVFSIDQVTADGTERAAGEHDTIPAAEARELILRGRARRFDPDADTTPDPDGQKVDGNQNGATA